MLFLVNQYTIHLQDDPIINYRNVSERNNLPYDMSRCSEEVH